MSDKDGEFRSFFLNFVQMKTTLNRSDSLILTFKMIAGWLTS